LKKENTAMRLACVVAIGGYTAADLEAKRDSLRAVLRPETQLDMFVAPSGVPYIESSVEFYLSEAAVARKIVEIAHLGYDAIVGTAFLDNGLDGARELVDIPVVGPAKTSLYLAATLANKFAVIAARGDLPKHVWSFAKLVGVVDRLVAVPTLSCTVTDFLHDEERAIQMAVAMGRTVMDQHGAEAIVLGCGTTSGLAPRIAKELGIPVLDPGRTAVKFAELLVDLGLSHSKKAYPTNDRVLKLLADMRLHEG
jgi:allantoin racemase